MSLSKIANNHKRKLVSDDGSIEEPWNKKQRQQLGLPALFQIFEGKMPRLGDEDEKSMDVAINIYGTAEEPIFLAADVGKICDLAERSTRDKCESYEDSRYAFKRTVLNPTATGNARKTQTVWLLTEAGLYRFLLASRNKLAKLFADWVLFDVIPSIRRTGKYEVSGDDRKKLEASNAALEAKLLETEKQHDEAQAYLRSKVQELGESLKNADVDREAQGYIVNELRETVAEAEAGKENDQKLFEDAQLALKEAEEHAVDLCQRYEDVSAEMAGAEEDLEVVTGYLQQFGGMNNVAAVLSHGYKEAADPMVNRNRLITLRAAAFGILHTCSFMLVKGFEEAHGRKMTGRELDAAVEQIMDSDNVVVPIRGRSNWIVLYTTLARIAKKRLVDSADGDEKDKRKKYSTEMPIAHLYRYSKNLNAWAAGALKMEQCVSYDKEIEAFYGKDSVEQFDFAKVEYDEIRAELEKNQPLITQFFA